MALMYGGRIIAMGVPATVRKEHYSQALLRLESSDTPLTMSALEKEPGVLDVAVFGAGLHVTVVDATTAAAHIREVLAAQNISISRLEAIEPSMEDVFVSLVEAEERKIA
jgi:ABC-2 type transport system ATP-binding protein